MIEFIEYDLDNGLHCILHQNNQNPIVNITLGYKVGSKDEEPSKKGVAHLFEHLMFQGSENVKKYEHFSFVQSAGGNCNAFTGQDITAYYEIFPSHQLEKGLWLESDRMQSLDLSEENLQNQKDVVIQEKLTNYDNAPYGTSFLNIFSEVFKGSNYEISTIGREEDIKAFTKTEAEEFHKNFYSPDNAVLIISGDIDYENCKLLIEKYFGNIHKKNSLKRNSNKVNKIEKDIRKTVNDNITLPALYICYSIPKVGTPEEFSLEYFTNLIANNTSSVLHKKLVYEKELLKSISCLKYQLEDAGLLVFVALINPGTDIKEIEESIYNEIINFANTEISENDFLKIRNGIEFDNTIKYLTLSNISLDALISWVYLKDTSLINNKIENYLSVTKEDVTESIKKYIINKPKVVITYLPNE